PIDAVDDLGDGVGEDMIRSDLVARWPGGPGLSDGLHGATEVGREQVRDALGDGVDLATGGAREGAFDDLAGFLARGVEGELLLAERAGEDVHQVALHAWNRRRMGSGAAMLATRRHRSCRCGSAQAGARLDSSGERD